MKTTLIEAAKNQISQIVEKSKEAPRFVNKYLSFYEGEKEGFAPHYVSRDHFMNIPEIAFGSSILTEEQVTQIIRENEDDEEEELRDEDGPDYLPNTRLNTEVHFGYEPH